MNIGLGLGLELGLGLGLAGTSFFLTLTLTLAHAYLLCISNAHAPICNGVKGPPNTILTFNGLYTHPYLAFSKRRYSIFAYVK